MKKTQIVFLLGLAGSGKDTVGEQFVDKGYTRVAFADALKEEYSKLHGVSIKDLHEQGPIKELHRPAIITLAETRRKENPLYWIEKSFAPHLEEANFFKEGLKLVVTDSRRISEMQWVLERKELMYDVNLEERGLWRRSAHYVDIKLFRIDRGITDLDGLTHQCIGFAKGLQQVLDYPFIDATIENHGTVQDLKTKVERIFDRYSF
jgi:phosphomevalonate kinase